ncbi:MAG: glycosyl transferase family 1 [Candidatus Magasanikbacteria bacterium]|nr:glycosyl transferase family 1 [Candidatus Magasanikbacteria bacterium]
MRLGLDARMYGPAGGIPRYIQQLIAELEILDTENEYVIFLRQENWHDWEPKNPRWRKVLANARWYTLKEQFIMPRLIRKAQIDLMHFPHWNIPFFWAGKFTAMIHDLILLHYPSQRATTLSPFFFKIKYWGFRRALKKALAKSCAIFTPSQFTKNDLLKNYLALTGAAPTPETENRIQVTALAPSPLPPPKPIEVAPLELSPFILSVGNSYPHKNLEALFDAFLASTRLMAHVLVHAGNRDDFSVELQKKFSANSDRLIFIDNPDDSALSGLYANAQAFIIPSLYEGFGLPALEAMTKNLPVAAANAASLPEIVGDAALLFDPTSKNAVKNALEQIIFDQNLRTELIAKGKTRLVHFSWQNTAKNTLALWKNCV